MPSCMAWNGELFDIASEEPAASGARGGRLDDDGADTGADFEEALGGQLPDHFLGGVGVYFHSASQRPDGGKRIAGTEFAAEHGLLGGEHDLVGDGDSGLRDESERDHSCTMSLVTANVKGENALTYRKPLADERGPNQSRDREGASLTLIRRGGKANGRKTFLAKTPRTP